MISVQLPTEQNHNLLNSLNSSPIRLSGAHIAFDVAQIDQVFQQDYANIPMAAPESQLLADARSRWENTVGGLQDALRVQAGVVGNLDGQRAELSALVGESQSPSVPCRRPRQAISSWRCNPSRSPT